MLMLASRRYAAPRIRTLSIAGLAPLFEPPADTWAAQLVPFLLGAFLAALLFLARRQTAAATAGPADGGEGEARLLQRLARSNVLAMMVVGRDGRVHAASDAALALVGHDREELARGSLRWDALAPAAWQDLQRLVSDARARETPAHEGELVRGNGARVPVRVEVTPLAGAEAGAEAGAGGRYLVLAADRSAAGPADGELERLRVELERLRIELERHRVLFDSTPVALFAKEYRGDTQGKYILANPMAAHIIGAPQVVDRTDHDLFPPPVAAMVQANDRRVISDGAPVIVEEWAPDARTGNMLCFLSTKVPLRDATGTPYGIGATALDITQQKLLTVRLAALVDAIPDTLIRIDAQGRIVDVENRGGFLEGSRQELIGTTLWDQPMPDEVRRQLVDIARLVRETGQLQAFEHTRATAGGERWYEARLVKSSDDEVVVLMRDITEARRIRAELQEANARLQAANEELREFAWVASHDLQEPLRTASSFAELLQRTYEGAFDDRGRRWLQTMLSGIQRMRALIDDVLAYSRVGRINRFEPVDTGALVRAVLEDMRASVEVAGAEIQVGDLPRVVANEVELKQVFQNLLSNALKFRRTGVTPHVSITARPAENGWMFVVADNGIGIEPAYHERIFLMFQRLHSRDEYPGTGIGLALVKKIVERQGGAVSLSSTPGQGTEVRFTVPKLGPPDSETDTAAPGSPKPDDAP
jgi:PAS domain S-box-containing protein